MQSQLKYSALSTIVTMKGKNDNNNIIIICTKLHLKQLTMQKVKF